MSPEHIAQGLWNEFRARSLPISGLIVAPGKIIKSKKKRKAVEDILRKKFHQLYKRQLRGLGKWCEQLGIKQEFVFAGGEPHFL